MLSQEIFRGQPLAHKHFVNDWLHLIKVKETNYNFISFVKIYLN